MNNNSNMLKGAIWNTLGSTMYGANSFFMLALVSRIGTVEEAGFFSIAFTTAQLMYIVGLLGINNYQQTDYMEKYSFSVYVKTKIVSCALMAVGCLLSIKLLHFSGVKAIYTILLTILMMLNAVGEMFQSLFFQKNRLDLSGSALFYRTFWPLMAFGLFVVITHNILLAVSIQIIVNLAITIYYAVRYVPRFAGTGTKKEEGNAPACLVMECFPLFVSVLIMNVVINTSKYGIEIFMDGTTQGYYNMIFMPAQVIHLCSHFIFKPLLNRYSIAFKDNRLSEVRAMMRRQITIVAGVTGVCCAAAGFCGTQVLSFIYNKNLTELKAALVLIVAGGGVYAIDQLFYFIFVILRMQRKIMLIYIVGLAASVIFTGILVKYFGIMGAVFSFILTHGIILMGYSGILLCRYRKR